MSKIKNHKKNYSYNYISVTNIKIIIIISLLSNYFKIKINIITNIKNIISNIKSEIDYLKTENYYMR